MNLEHLRVVIVSHAGIKQINRSVYRLLQERVPSLSLVVPSRLQLGSGKIIHVESEATGNLVVVPLDLKGRNPRMYFYPGLLLWLAKYKPDLVILENDPVSRLGLQLSRWCRRNNVKIICQTYENDQRDFFKSLRQQGVKAAVRSSAIKLMNVRMASKVDVLLVVNRDSEAIFKRYGYNHVIRIPLGLDKKVFFQDDRLRQVNRKNLGLSEGTVLLAYFGRLVPQKGVHLLIMALRELLQYKWLLLLDHIHDSEDSYSEEIKTLIRDYKMQERVLFFEADHFEIAGYMRGADIAIAPSITTTTFKEQYGRAVQEAMACGCVCVVSDSGHLKDLVGDESLVFPEGRTDRLRDLLRKLITDGHLRKQYSSLLSARAREHLSTEAQCEMLVKVVEKIFSTDGSVRLQPSTTTIN